MIVASGKIGVDVMIELCQRVLDGRGMPDEWKTSVIVPIFKGKGDVMRVVYDIIFNPFFVVVVVDYVISERDF